MTPLLPLEVAHPLHKQGLTLGGAAHGCIHTTFTPHSVAVATEQGGAPSNVIWVQVGTDRHPATTDHGVAWDPLEWCACCALAPLHG
jgi:hypothetical protein